jgi:hypothetical protein
VAVKGRGDLLVHHFDAVVEPQEAGGQLGDDHLDHLLAGQLEVLAAGSGQGADGDTGSVPDVPAAEPLGQAGLAEPAEPVRAGVLSQ